MATFPVSRFPVPELKDLAEDIRAKILEVQEKAGFVPNVFLTFAHRPDEFRAFFAYHDALLLRDSGPTNPGLTKGEKEMIIVATSGANGCLYCVVAHGAILRIYEKNPLLADQLAVNYLKADITPRQKAMLGFAMKVCLASDGIGEDDFAALRGHGFSDEDAWGHRRDHRALRPLEPDGERHVDAAERRVLPDGTGAEVEGMTRGASRGPLAGMALAAVTQPISHPVPADDAAYRLRKGTLKLAYRTARRSLQFAASGQRTSLRTAIDRDWKCCLWIHEEAPQVGDALMDLAPRSLLHENGIAVDLFAAPHLVALFDGDRWLRRVIADPAAIDPAAYDFAIVSSHARKALATKRGFAPALPWVSLAGYYGVPDYQRAQFNARRLADLLGLDPDDRSLRVHARQKLDLREPASSPLPKVTGPCIALALGGVRADRTYRHWPAVAAALQARGVRDLVLVGSANGFEVAADIAAVVTTGAGRDPSAAPVTLHNWIDRASLHGTRALIEACDLVVCADGGLMHLALTTGTRVLPLFASAMDPAWRLPPGFDGEALRAARPDVSAIAPERVATAAWRCLDRRSG